jgi:hypothetical protein
VNPHLACFLFGMAGNIAVEVLKILGYFQRGRFHRQYGDWRFWVVRSVLVLISGLMALAYSMSGQQIPALAFTIGAASPLLISQMARRSPFEDQPKLPGDGPNPPIG